MKLRYQAALASLAFLLGSVTPVYAHAHQDIAARTHSVVYHDRTPRVHSHGGGHHQHQHQS